MKLDDLAFKSTCKYDFDKGLLVCAGGASVYTLRFLADVDGGGGYLLETSAGGADGSYPKSGGELSAWLRAICRIEDEDLINEIIADVKRRS